MCGLVFDLVIRKFKEYDVYDAECLFWGQALLTLKSAKFLKTHLEMEWVDLWQLL